MSVSEVLGCVAAVTSAFHTSAELVQAMRERRDKKKKKRKEKEEEQAVQEKMLLQNLETGEQTIQHTYQTEAKRLGPIFETGDGRRNVITTSEASANLFQKPREVS